MADVVQTELSTFAHKVLYAHAGVLVLILVLVGLGGYCGLKSYDAQLAKAQVTEQKYEAAQKTLTDLLATDAQERAAMQAQQANLIGQIAKRDKTPPSAPVIAALQPNATAETAANVLGLVFSLSPYPSATPDNKVVLSVPNAQELVKNGVELNKLRPDYADEVKLYDLEQQKSTSLNNDLVQCKTTLVASQKEATAYKKIAVKGRWKKFLGGAEKVGTLVGGLVLGHMI